jgi:hypothetical protein
VLPDACTKIVAGFQGTETRSPAFFVYDVFLRRIIRSFKVPNPDYVPPLQVLNSDDLPEPPVMGKKKSNAAQEEAKPITPFLELKASEIRAMEISPRGSYLVFNIGRYLYIHSLLVHEKLVKVMKPLYLSERSNQFLTQIVEKPAADTKSNEDFVRADIRR